MLNSMVHHPIPTRGFLYHSMGSLPSPVNKDLYSTLDLVLSNFSTPDEALEKLDSGQYVINNSLLSQPRDGDNYSKLQCSKLINSCAVLVAVQDKYQTTTTEKEQYLRSWSCCTACTSKIRLQSNAGKQNDCLACDTVVAIMLQIREPPLLQML